jgi:hypothetical protein
LLGAGSQKKAVKKATAQQVAALQQAIDEQRRQFDVTNTNFQPYRDIGGKGLAGLGDLVGVNGAPQQQSAIDALKASPFYQSLFRTGEENVLQTAAATGGLRGGNTQRGLADFGADTLAQTIQQQLASLSGLAGMGMGATNAVANFGQHTADAVSGDLTQQGQARASGSLAIGGINNQMWNNAGSFLDQAISAFLPGGGGFGSILKGGF